MPNTKQTPLSFAAAVMFLGIAIFRIMSLVTSFKTIQELNSYGSTYLGKVMWVLWACLILDLIVAVGVIAAVVFLCMGDMDRYGLAAIVIGGGIAVEYILLLIETLSGLGSYSAQYFFNWRVILSYSAMGCFAACFIHSGVLARKVEQGEPLGKKWVTSPMLLVLGIVCIMIAVSGSGVTISEMLSSGDESWKTITAIVLEFLALLFVGLHMNYRKNMEIVYGNRQKPTVYGVPAYNANPYAPFNNPVQGSVPYPNQQQGYGAQQGGYGGYGAAGQQNYGGYAGYGAAGQQQDPYADPYQGYFQPTDNDKT